ncbi:uncharacterized protein LOC126704032 [Quercus robur]|uniref:uncharacterized protein LOC126704032 n=1 Tax=Quercus robur TaxID=38942 RepID=UPI002163D5A9|nr:uncharacterized protein LOC126704032 [Quercus robur]
MAALGRIGTYSFEVMSVSSSHTEDPIPEPKRGKMQPHDDALVVTLRIGSYDVRRVLVDQGSGVEIMHPNLYNGLKLKPEDLVSYDSLLVGFDGKTIIPKGMIRLLVQVGSEVMEVNFIVVDAYLPYTVILARPWLHAMGAVSSTLHLKVKYPSGDHVEELIGSQTMEREELLAFLRRNVDVFAWNAYETPGVDLNFICHHLNVNPTIIPKKQLPWHSSKEYEEAIKEEVVKLKCAGAIKKVFYPAWLTNTVVVKKKSGKWRVCVDFTDLNKACPKDPFPISRIDQLVDATRMMTRMFESQLGNNIEVYIDDMVVKSKVVFEHLSDLGNVFEVLWRHKLRLNASKCSFVVSSGKFLGYMVTHCEIEVNPDQIKVISDLQPPWNPKEVQKLTGMTVALNRFISQSTNKCRPFFQLLHKWKGFEWNEERALGF